MMIVYPPERKPKSRPVDVTAIGRAGAALESAYDYLRKPGDPLFGEVDCSHRILALAAAMVASEPLVAALRDIRAMATPHANATVKRMARRAAQGIEADAPEHSIHSSSGRG